MSETEVIELCRTSIITLVIVCGPILVIMMLLGTVISIFQAVTQISEQTLAMVPKVMLVFGLSILLMPFMLSKLTEFFEHEVADRIVAIGVGARDNGGAPFTPGTGITPAPAPTAAAAGG
ncbi:flagellar biosynthetic protein FliQ [Azospirillum sp. BE72]|uniref:flagellar biosynthetic protein FliQ n=1 Tax=Azospirillum sp. BE72 TaxID=2817776 RepID=UPI00285E0A4D|nr:flagellar biosynthetic protein FliQ [Azospirillum sp. BE72]MDR6770621.1 flagellar biosynthetic protein FliQ [Azospirillum sp. BE72]